MMRFGILLACSILPAPSWQCEPTRGHTEIFRIPRPIWKHWNRVIWLSPWTANTSLTVGLTVALMLSTQAVSNMETPWPTYHVRKKAIAAVQLLLSWTWRIK
eukprot:scaffold19011_cov33-Attheya_sp.AAC.1